MPEPEQPPQDAPNDAKSIEEIYRKERGSLLLKLCRLLGSRQDGEDAMHDVFVRALRDERKDVQEPKLFLLRSIRNEAYDELRRRKRRDNILLRLLENQHSSRHASPEEEYAGDTLCNALAKAVASLPKEQRIALTLMLDGLSTAEAALRMGHRKRKVRKLFTKALANLRAVVATVSGGADE